MTVTTTISKKQYAKIEQIVQSFNVSTRIPIAFSFAIRNTLSNHWSHSKLPRGLIFDLAILFGCQSPNFEEVIQVAEAIYENDK